MSTAHLLALLVTILGIVLCVSLIAMVLLGKRLDSGTDGPQEIEFKGLRAKTNVIIMFLLVSLVPAVLPLYYLVRSESVSLPGVTMYETWKVRGQILAEDPEAATLLIQPEPTRSSINQDGKFFANIPVERNAEGKLNFPTFIIDHPAHPRVSVDLNGGSYGQRDFQPKFNSEEKSISLQEPIKLAPKKPDAGIARGGNGP
jgi:hypothetical protein